MELSTLASLLGSERVRWLAVVAAAAVSRAIRAGFGGARGGGGWRGRASRAQRERDGLLGGFGQLDRDRLAGDRRATGLEYVFTRIGGQRNANHRGGQRGAVHLDGDVGGGRRALQRDRHGRQACVDRVLLLLGRCLRGHEGLRRVGRQRLASDLEVCLVGRDQPPELGLSASHVQQMRWGMYELFGARQVIDGLFVLAGVERARGRCWRRREPSLAPGQSAQTRSEPRSVHRHWKPSRG